MPHDDVPHIANHLEQREFLRLHLPRYRVAGRAEKGRIIDEFVSMTGFHRKHAMRLLTRGPVGPRQPFYDEKVREAAVVAWKAAGRPGSRRLKKLLPELVATMVKRGDLSRDLVVLGKLLAASAATLDRLVAPVRLKTRVAAFEERLARVSDVARDLADFRIPDELSEPERRHLEAQLDDLVGVIRQAASAAKVANAGVHVIGSDDPEKVTQTEDKAAE